MKVTNKKVVTMDTMIEVSREDIINALNASGKFHIPYNARVWVECEARHQYDIDSGSFMNVRYNSTEDVPEEYTDHVPF